MTPGPRRQPSRSLVLSIACMAQFVVVLNATIVVVALPSIQDDLAFKSEDLTWVVNSYGLTFGGFLLLGGRAADLCGRRRMFITGLMIFTAASLAAGVANSQQLLLAARALQGLGAAAVAPITLVIVTVSFPEGPERRRALSIWGAVNAGASSIALLLGGVLTEVLSWAAIFLFNVPVGMLIIAFSARWLTDSSPRVGSGVDVAGAIAIVGATSALTYTMISGGEEGWTALITTVSGAVALSFVGMFIAVERVHRAPLIPLRVFRVRAFSVAIMARSVVGGVIMTVAYLTTLYLQHVLGYSPLQTGLAFMPAIAMFSVGSLVAHRLIQRIGVRLALPGVLVLAAAGATLLTRLNSDATFVTDVMPAMIVIYLGLGCAGVIVTILVMTSLPERDAGLAAGLNATSGRTGASCWLALFSAIAFAGTAGVSTGKSPESALLTGYHLAFWGVAALVILTLLTVAVLLWRLPPVHPPQN